MIAFKATLRCSSFVFPVLDRLLLKKHAIKWMNKITVRYIDLHFNFFEPSVISVWCILLWICSCFLFGDLHLYLVFRLLTYLFCSFCRFLVAYARYHWKSWLHTSKLVLTIMLLIQRRPRSNSAAEPSVGATSTANRNNRSVTGIGSTSNLRVLPLLLPFLFFFILLNLVYLWFAQKPVRSEN